MPLDPHQSRFEKVLQLKLLQRSSHRLTEEACLIKMFKYFDIYDRGTVLFSDFMRTIEKIGLYYSPAEMQPLFQYYDGNGNGVLDYKEFSSIVFGNSDMLKGQQVKRPPTANTKE